MCRTGVKTITNKNLLRRITYSIYRAKIYFGNSTMPFSHEKQVHHKEYKFYIPFLKNILY